MYVYRHPVNKAIFKETMWYNFGLLAGVEMGITDAAVVIGDELVVMASVGSRIEEEPGVDLLGSLRQQIDGSVKAPEGTSGAVAP